MKLLLILIFTNFLFAKEIYYNGQLLNEKNLFKYLNNVELQNLSWNNEDYLPYLYNKYNENSKSFKKMVSYKEFLDKEFEKLKYDYLLVFSSGKSKKEFVDLYLEVFHKDLDTITKDLNDFKRPLFYDKMIEYILYTPNNSNINEMPNNIETFNHIIKYYNLFNYSGKINAINKIEEILKEVKTTEEILLEINNIKPNFKEFTNIELIVYYCSLIDTLSLNNNNIKINLLKNIEYGNDIIELTSKFYLDVLSEEEYILLMRKISKDNYSFEQFLVDSSYLKDLFNYIDNPNNYNFKH